jgi:glycosyltransferase involved in cell wall biosynthesis
MTERILFVTQTPEFGGAEKHLLDLVRRMDDRLDCRILCLGRDFFTEPLRGRANVHVDCVPVITARRFMKYWWLFLTMRPSIIVLVKGIFDHHPFAAHVAARLVGSRRLIVIEHLIADPPPAEVEGVGIRAALRRWFGWRAKYMRTMRWQGWLAHATVCVSEAVRRRLVEGYGYPPSRTITIRNGIDRLHYQPKPRISACETDLSASAVTLVCAARLSSAKRIDVLLDALAMLLTDSVSWRCLILGTGPLEAELRARADRLGLSGRVTFLGHVDDVRPYLREADLFVLSSDKEGLPLALLEAMACGLPAIVTDVGGTGEAVDHKETGLLVERDNPKELALAIRYLLLDSVARESMGEAARQRIDQHFDIDQAMNRIQSVILA